MSTKSKAHNLNCLVHGYGADIILQQIIIQYRISKKYGP
uniref:Uncharacterized protein n=1 Tax=Arundo donax TaxID=35708 RepID=A0A0A9CFR7_ARUDO